MYKGTHRKSICTAALCCAAVLLVLLFSLWHMAESAGHDCDGEECAICLQAQHARSGLRLLSLGFAAGASFGARRRFGRAAISVLCTPPALPRATLVGHKIQLNI